MGLILDLAVIAIAGVVIVSLALLAWTLAVSAVASIGASRQALADLRQSALEAEASIAETSTRLRAATEALADRSREWRGDLGPADVASGAPMEAQTTSGQGDLTKA